MKKSLIWGVFIALAALMGLAVLGSYLPEIDGVIERHRLNSILEKLAKQKAAHEALLRADFDGGKTPEETIDLLITALTQVKPVSASKYYEVDVQAKALASFQKELQEKGNLQSSIDYFSEVKAKGKKTCSENKYEKTCEFSYDYITDKDETVSVAGRVEQIFVPKGTRQSAGVSLVLNQFTRVWKLLR